MTSVGLLLAAGAGTRFGRPKALVRFDDELLVERGLRLLHEGGCKAVVVVLGAEAERVRAAADLGRARVVVADDWAAGQSASLTAGLAAAADTAATAAIVTLVDQPLLGPAAVARLRDEGRGTAGSAPADAAMATYGGRPGHPVLLGRAVWAEVAAQATGDTGARAWLRAHPERVRLVPCDGTGRPDDADTPAELARLEALGRVPGASPG
ncbi:MAG: hypothetical protein JWM67_2810 [Mycobacterium sp.]|nr:hypothetical protein [Mycobacterium sp.]